MREASPVLSEGAEEAADAAREAAAEVEVGEGEVAARVNSRRASFGWLCSGHCV